MGFQGAATTQAVFSLGYHGARSAHTRKDSPTSIPEQDMRHVATLARIAPSDERVATLQPEERGLNLAYETHVAAVKVDSLLGEVALERVLETGDPPATVPGS